jgi:predicted RNA-binding Zn-ribbon protein involved in translation (DUF1610 family)
MWHKIQVGDRKAQQRMEEYNIQDIVLLEKVYHKLLPWINNHPNLNLYQETNHACPNCGSLNIQKRGVAQKKVSVVQRYQCNDCGSWSQSGKSLELPDGNKSVEIR